MTIYFFSLGIDHFFGGDSLQLCLEIPADSIKQMQGVEYKEHRIFNFQVQSLPSTQIEYIFRLLLKISVSGWHLRDNTYLSMGRPLEDGQ